MSVVPALLQAIVSVDGEALVMHATEKPYVVVAPSGQVELASTGLTLEAVSSIVAQLLPPAFQQSLDEFGAVQYNLPPQPEFPREQFTLIAARGGDDVWAEIRRRRVPDEDRGAEALFSVPPPAAPSEGPLDAPVPAAITGAALSDDVLAFSPARSVHEEPAAAPSSTTSEAWAPVALSMFEPPVSAVHAAQATGVVLQMARSPIRQDTSPVSFSDDAWPGLERLLRTAAAHDASTLYLSSNSRPLVRVDGKLHVLDGEAALTPTHIASLLATSGPNGDRLGQGTTTRWWTSESAGRVSCTTFADRSGPGVIVRLARRAMPAESLGLSRELQSLAMEADGLVIVAGPRSSGKRTLIAALVELINRTRRDHVITIERAIGIVHTSAQAFISQREVSGADGDMLTAARTALAEDPDVLVLEEIRTDALIALGLEAAEDGRLVVAGMTANSATAVIERVIEAGASDSARTFRLSLARHLRGVVAQVLLPKAGGGRVAAREVLLNTPVVAGLIAEGDTVRLPLAMEGGRQQGMMTLTESLLECVQSHGVDVRDISRYVSDAAAFLALLEQRGIDTSAIDRRA